MVSLQIHPSLICSPYAEQALTMAIEAGLPVGVHIDFVTEFHPSQSPFGSEFGRSDMAN